jgi:hypothetical protein
MRPRKSIQTKDISGLLSKYLTFVMEPSELNQHNNGRCAGQPRNSWQYPYRHWGIPNFLYKGYISPRGMKQTAHDPTTVALYLYSSSYLDVVCN